jgi:hypothetical protein
MTEYNVVDRYQNFGGTTAFTFKIEVYSQNGNAGATYQATLTWNTTT